MKTKQTILAFIAVLFLNSFIPASATETTLYYSSGSFGLMGEDYTDNRDEVWFLESSTSSPFSLVYNADLEYSCDYIIVYGVDADGNETEIQTITGSESNTISTQIPSGRAKIVFHSDGSGSNSSGYSGFEILYSLEDNLDISGTLHVVGDVTTDGALTTAGGITAWGKTFFGGNVGIGYSNPQNKLDVAGTIRATEIKVVSINQFADFVFEPKYNLPKLSEVKSYIQSNGHLPNIPSAADVKEHGVSLVEMQVKLLQKIEELTLYAIEQQKEIETLKQALKTDRKE